MHMQEVVDIGEEQQKAEYYMKRLMTVHISEGQFKHLFAEVIADGLRTEIGDVTYFSILHFVEKQYDTLIKNAVDMTKELYLSSEQYKEDVEYYEEHRRDSL